MRVLLLANGRVGAHVAARLREVDEVVGVVLHPPERRRDGEAILDALALPQARVFDGARLREPAMLAALRGLDAEIGVSALFGYILRPALLDALPRGCVNLHPAYLPYNRGAHPNVWSIVDGTPAGATLHWVDAGVDTGDVVARQPVAVEPVDTAATLYAKLEAACIALFDATWPLVRAGCAPREPQPVGGGTAHRVADLARLDTLDLDERCTARELLARLRARTFAPHRGVTYRDGGRQVEVTVSLRYVDAEAVDA